MGDRAVAEAGPVSQRTILSRCCALGCCYHSAPCVAATDPGCMEHIFADAIKSFLSRDAFKL